MRNRNYEQMGGDLMSNLLINEPPLQVLPSLAKAIGLNEAIFIQQLHYWLRHAKVEHDGKKWIYKTLLDWRKQDFPFWSVDTIKRTISSLKKQDLLLIEKLSSNSFNRVNHYTLSYEKLAEIGVNKPKTPAVVDKCNMHQSAGAECTQQEGNMHQSDKCNMHQSLRDNKETNKESGHAQKITDDVLSVREQNAESISNWQAPSKKTMQDELLKAGKKLDMTDSQYLSHVSDFKAHYEQAAADGKPIKRENLRRSKLKLWLMNIADRQPKQDADTANRPHSNRSDAFTPSNQPRLTRQQQIEQNKIAMQQVGL